MRRAPWFIALMGTAALAGTVVMVNRGPAAPVTCSPVTTGHTFDETFDPTGYDIMTECNNSSCVPDSTMDEDNTDSSGACFDTQWFYAQASTASDHAAAYYQFTPADVLYMRTYVKFTTLNPSAGTYFIRVDDAAVTSCISSASSYPLSVRKTVSDSDIELRCNGSAVAAYSIPDVSIAYRIELLYDNTGDTVAWKIYRTDTGGIVADATETCVMSASAATLCLGSFSAGATPLGVRFDAVAGSTAGWIGE